MSNDLDSYIHSSPDRANDIANRVMARRNFAQFVQYTKPDYESNWHHDIICRELDDFIKSPTRDRMMIFVGPRRGKSELVSRRLPAFAFGLNPDLNIIATSYGADLAQGMNRDVQRVIDSAEYRRVFPDTNLSGSNVKTNSKGSYIRTSDRFEIVGHSGAYRSAGVGGGITGMGGDLCALFDTPILTRDGYRTINSLSVGSLVWSYNHGTNKLELKPVTNIKRRRTNETVTVTSSDGRKSVFTPDHPHYTIGRGYVEAQDITGQDRLIQETIYPSGVTRLLTITQLLWCNIREAKYRLYAQLGKTPTLSAKGMPKRSPRKQHFFRRMGRKFNVLLSRFLHRNPRASSNVKDRFEFTSGAKVTKNSNREVTVYDITVEGNHNFFANGILVHNCIIDDPLKDMKEALSKTVKKGVYDWYTSTLYTRLSKKGKIIIILTRWADDDLAGRLLDDAKRSSDADQWEILCFPEEYDEHHDHVHPDDPRTEQGQILWPEWFPYDRVKKTKVSVGSKVWSSLYQQSPSPDGGTIFKETWFNYFDDMPDFDYKVASWDCTFKDTANADYVAGGVWGVKGANKYLLYLIKERLNFPNTIKTMLRINNMFKGLRYTLVEDKANGPAVVATLKSKIPGLITYCPRESKEARANAVSPQFEAGNIWLPNPYYKPNKERFAWIDQLLNPFIDEFKTFPFGANDDCVDMTTQFLLKEGSVPNWIEEMMSASGKPKTIDEVNSDKLVGSLSDMLGWNIQDSDTPITAFESDEEKAFYDNYKS